MWMWIYGFWFVHSFRWHYFSTCYDVIQNECCKFARDNNIQYKYILYTILVEQIFGPLNERTTTTTKNRFDFIAKVVKTSKRKEAAHTHTKRNEHQIASNRIERKNETKNQIKISVDLTCRSLMLLLLLWYWCAHRYKVQNKNKKRKTNNRVRWYSDRQSIFFIPLFCSLFLSFYVLGYVNPV